uniref:HTH iclR-type domain-containing protein n=1 Tax=Caulobacter sp. (strain K31) TaxID=366602 RepID=B0T0L3_CAUSK
MSPQTPPAVVRNHLSLGADFSLRFLALFSPMFDGDVVMTLVFVAAVQASTQHLRQGGRGVTLPGAFFADELRRPTSISALARSLAMPVETTRRYVIKLAARGWIQRTSAGGVQVTSSALARPDIQAALAANSANLERLAADLRRLARLREA